METAPEITTGELHEFLLNTAVVAPVMIHGAPGIGKTAIIEQFAESLGMECVSLLGSQLAPEDIIGVPRIEGHVSVFCPPRNIARDEPYVLFLDELNASSPDVQKAFYSLIHERRLGEYRLPKDSIVVAAGNRSSDNAIVRQMSSALINRMVHVTLRVSVDAWLEWAVHAGVHPVVHEYVRQHPAQLWRKPPKEERTFSTPRAWELLSRMMLSWGDDHLTSQRVGLLARSVLSPSDAQQFEVWFRNSDRLFLLNHIIKGTRAWPQEPSERELLHYLTLAFRDQIIKELPANAEKLSANTKKFQARALELMRSLADIAPDLAQMVIVANENGDSIPDWFLLAIGEELPNIVARHKPQIPA